jgi:hypothetical protein
MRRALAIAVVLAAAGAAAWWTFGRGDDVPAAGEGSGAPRTWISSRGESWRGTLELSGRVLDAEAYPLSRARVRVHNLLRVPGEAPLPVLQTDDAGRFSVSGLGSVLFALFVESEEGERPLFPSVFAGQGPMDLRLHPTKAPDVGLVARVVGPDGTPIPRADALPRWNDRRPLVEVVNGRFFREDDRRVYEVFGARDADSNALPIGPGLWRPGDDGVLRLPEGKTLEGEVVDESGNGVFGAQVFAYPKTGDNVWYGLKFPDMHGRAFTNASGRFRLVSLGDGDYYLRVDPLPPHLAPEIVEGAVGTTTTRVRVVAGLEADVRVLDRNGVVLSGAIVGAEGARWAQVTDVEGRARLSQLRRSGPYRLRVSPPRSRGDLKSVTLPWTPAETTVRLERAWRFFGTVRRSDGSRVSSHVFKRRSPREKWVYAARTEVDGTFELREQEEGPWFLAAASDYRTAPGTEARVTDTETAVELTAHPASAPAK